jgi:hypothetical protein
MKIEINILQYKEYSSELSIMSGTVHETSSSSSSSNVPQRGSMTIDIRPMIEDVSQVMTKHITSILSGVIGEYTMYKETHDTIMGLPCVRKLQERITELEQSGGGVASNDHNNHDNRTPNREDEIAQLQSAIVDLNRYIHALESKVDMKSVASTGNDVNRHEEESVKLEIHENDQQQDDDDDEQEEEQTILSSTTHKNVIISSDALVEEEEGDAADPVDDGEEAEEDGDGDVESDATEEKADETAADQEEEAASEEEEEEDAEEEAADQEEAEAEDEVEATTADEEAEDEAEGDEEEEEAADQEEEAEEEEVEEAAQAEADPEEEAEIEVSEVKIKGKTYFTTDPQNGIIYACVDDDVGDEVGVFKNGIAMFNKGKK